MQPNHFHRGLQRLNNAHWEQVLWKPHRVAPASISNLPKESTILRFSTQGCWDVSHGRLWHFKRGQRLMLALDSHSLICSANIQVWKDACLNIYSNILTQVGILDSQNLTINFEFNGCIKHPFDASTLNRSFHDVACTLRKLVLHFLSHWMGYDRGDGFYFRFGTKWVSIWFKIERKTVTTIISHSIWKEMEY